MLRVGSKDLQNKFSGKCVIIGCGVSAPDIKPYLSTPGLFTIGINDAFKLGRLDMLVVNDPPYRWTKHRLDSMFNDCCVRFFCSRFIDKFQWVRAGCFVDYKLSERGKFDLDGNGERLGNNRTTFFAACCLAYHMGFTDIGMIGNDFLDGHFYKKDGRYNLSSDFNMINGTFCQLEHELHDRDVSFVNLSAVSRVDVTKVPLQDWLGICI